MRLFRCVGSLVSTSLRYAYSSGLGPPFQFELVTCSIRPSHPFQRTWSPVPADLVIRSGGPSHPFQPMWSWFLATVVVLFALPSLGWHLVSRSYSGLPALRNRYLRLECGIAGEALVLLGLQRLSSR